MRAAAHGNVGLELRPEAAQVLAIEQDEHLAPEVQEVDVVHT